MKISYTFQNENAKTIYQNGELLKYSTEGSSGFDVKACEIKALPSMEEKNFPFILEPYKRILIQTGLSFMIPKGFEIQIRPRSGLALKHGISIVNTPGTIDSDYRGEIGVILINLSENNFEIQKGDRIAQAVLCPIMQANFIQVENLNATERSASGFGSTGLG